MWKPLNALPGYLGGKRKLLKDIFRTVPDKDQAPIFADCFMGGGSVSLFAKARGHKVLSNDLAMRSYIIGRALIANDSVKIEEADLARLFENPVEEGFIQRKYPKVFTSNQAQFLDTALANIWAMKNDDGKKYPLLLLMIKHIIAVRNFGKFTHTKDAQELEARRFEYPLRSSGHARANLNMIHHPLPQLRKYAENINHAIFANGQTNEVTQMDVQEFLKGRTGDIAYFDPPYADTTSYEQEYKVLDDILYLGKRGPEMETNPWSNSEGARAEFRKAFKAAKGFKKWVVSMGQTREDSGISAEELKSIMEEFRPADMILLEHTWSVGNAGGKGGKTDNTEYLIVSK